MKSEAITSDKAGTLGELLRVAIPLIVSSGSTAMMYVIDRVFLTWDSVNSMTAALPAGVLHWNLAALAMGTIAYGNAFIGQYEGAARHDRVGPVIWQGIYLAIVAALVALACVPAAPTLFRWFGHEQVVQDLELKFFSILCYGTLPLLLDTALSSFFSGRGQTTTVMVINVIGMMINVVLDYIFIFGKLGLPAMGIEGAALATVCAFTSISLMYVGAMWWTAGDGRYHLWIGRRFDRELLLRLLKFGLPSGLQQFLEIACWTIFIQFMGRLGTEQLAATGLVFNLNSLVFVPLLGLATAVTVLTGHRIGEGKPQLAVRTAWLAYGVAALYTAIFCVIYLFAPDLILRPYQLAEHAELRAMVTQLLRLVAVYVWFDALAVVFGAAIRGAGDTRFAMVFSVSCGVVLLVVPTYFASLRGPDGFWIAWYAATTCISIVGIGFWIRFQQGRWMSMRIIEPAPPELFGTGSRPSPERSAVATH